MKFKDIQVSYKVMKFLKSIENDILFYDNKVLEIAKECAEKDGNNFKTTQDGGLVLSKDKIKEWNSRIADLGDIEVEISSPSFKLVDFAECNFTLGELSTLEPLISE